MDPDLLRSIPVESVMQKSLVLELDSSRTICEAERDINAFNVEHPDSALVHSYPVFEKGCYIGILDWNLVLRNIVSTEGGKTVLLVADCVTYSPLLPASVDLHTAMKFMLKHSLIEVYVKNASGKILGILPSSTIMNTYDRVVRENIKH